MVEFIDITSDQPRFPTHSPVMPFVPEDTTPQEQFFVWIKGWPKGREYAPDLFAGVVEARSPKGAARRARKNLRDLSISTQHADVYVYVLDQESMTWKCNRTGPDGFCWRHVGLSVEEDMIQKMLGRVRLQQALSRSWRMRMPFNDIPIYRLFGD